LRQTYLQALEQMIALLQKQQDYRSAIGYAQQLLREDPLAEEAYLYLIRLYALTGDRAKALRVYHTCVTTMRSEFGVEPGPVTHQAYEQLLKMDAPQHAQLVSQTALIGTAPLVGRQEEWQRAVSGIKEVAEAARKKGIKLAMEPLNRFETDMINVVSQGLTFIRD
jgi:DNA-binding SARP family transcriptional activator